MGSERLTSLALLHNHPDMAPDANDVLQKFDASGHRRISVVFGDRTSVIYSATDMHVPALLLVNFLSHLA